MKTKIIERLQEQHVTAIDYDSILAIWQDLSENVDGFIVDIDKIDTVDCIYFQVSYYSTILKKTIILDHEAESEYTNDQLEKFASDLASHNEEALLVEAGLVDSETLDAIDNIVVMNYDNELHHYEESDSEEGHIFESYQIVEDWLKSTSVRPRYTVERKKEGCPDCGSDTQINYRVQRGCTEIRSEHCLGGCGWEEVKK